MTSGIRPAATGWSTSIVIDCGAKCTVSPSTRATSSAPASFQPAGSFSDAVIRIASGSSPSGDSHDGVPVDHRAFRVGRRGGAERAAAGRHDIVVGGRHRPRAGRHGDVERVHVDEIATPRQFGAVRENVQAGQIGDRSRRHVLAGNPLRIDERHRSRPRGHRKRRMQDLHASLRGVHAQRHRRLRRRARRTANQDERGHDDGANGSDHAAP